MSEQGKRRVENTRLVRLPNGQLVMQKVDESSDSAKREVAPKANTNVSLPRAESMSNMPVGQERLEQSRSKLKSKKQNKSKKKTDDKDIGDVWEEQMRLKEEADRLELEYEIAKKMTKELKKKVRERDQPYNYADPAFKDLLSPEVKDFGKKLKPVADKTKDIAGNSWSIAKVSAKKIRIGAKLLIKKYFASKKALIATPIILVLVVGVVGLGNVIGNRKGNVSSQAVQSATDSQTPKIPLNQKPEFAVLVPKNKKIEDMGGFAKVSPANSAAAYAFIDQVKGVNIKVTQQKLPDTIKANPITELEKLAKNFNATKQLELDGNSVYSGKSAKGAQTLIFTKDDVLVFIAAESTVAEVDWVQYLTNLSKQ